MVLATPRSWLLVFDFAVHASHTPAAPVSYRRDLANVSKGLIPPVLNSFFLAFSNFSTADPPTHRRPSSPQNPHQRIMCYVHQNTVPSLQSRPVRSRRNPAPCLHRAEGRGPGGRGPVRCLGPDLSTVCHSPSSSPLAPVRGEPRAYAFGPILPLLAGPLGPGPP